MFITPKITSKFIIYGDCLRTSRHMLEAARHKSTMPDIHLAGGIGHGVLLPG